LTVPVDITANHLTKKQIKRTSRGQLRTEKPVNII
jgi:hypothetical protein